MRVMKALMYSRQYFNVDGFVLQDSVVIGEIHDTKSLPIEDLGVSRIKKADFGFNKDRSPASPAFRHQVKSVNRIVMTASMSLSLDVVVRRAHHRDSV